MKYKGGGEKMVNDTTRMQDIEDLMDELFKFGKEKGREEQKEKGFTIMKGAYQNGYDEGYNKAKKEEEDKDDYQHWYDVGFDDGYGEAAEAFKNSDYYTEDTITDCQEAR